MGTDAHPNVTCDKSGMCPIIGLRFNLIGQDYDLCEAEFDKLEPAEQARYERIEPPFLHCLKDNESLTSLKCARSLSLYLCAHMHSGLQTPRACTSAPLGPVDALNVFLCSIDGHPLLIKQLKGDKPAESIDLSNKKLNVASAVVIASLILAPTL